MGRALAALAGSFLTIPSLAWGDAGPASSPVTIEWNAPPGCPDVNEVRAAVESMVSSSSLRPGAPQVSASATVAQNAFGGFTLRMQIQTPSAAEEKTLEAETCASAADAYELVVAFALDPNAGRETTPERGRQTTSPSRPAAVSLSRPETIASAGTAPAPAIRASAGAIAAVGVGLLPFPAYGVGASVAVERGLRWELAGMYWPEEPTSVRVGSSTFGAQVNLASVRSSLCCARGPGALCVAGEVGAMQASGTGVALQGHGTSWWLAPTVAGALRMHLAGSLDLRFRLDVGVPIFRPSFVLEHVGPPSPVQAYQPAPVFAVLGAETEFPFFSTDSSETRHVHR
jgi:hypothetical protein